MRKLNILIGLIFITCVPCFAQRNQDIDSLIKWDLRGLNENFNLIQREAANLNETERLEIYNQNKKSVWIGGLINILPPGGIGSLIQGDYISGGITMGGELIGLGIFSVGAIMAFVPAIMVLPMFTDEGLRTIENGMIMMTAGGITAAAFHLFGIIRAFYYPHAYNNKLKTALWTETNSLTFNIIPSVNITENDIEVTLISIKW